MIRGRGSVARCQPKGKPNTALGTTTSHTCLCLSCRHGLQSEAAWRLCQDVLWDAAAVLLCEQEEWGRGGDQGGRPLPSPALSGGGEEVRRRREALWKMSTAQVRYNVHTVTVSHGFWRIWRQATTWLTDYLCKTHPSDRPPVISKSP